MVLGCRWSVQQLEGFLKSYLPNLYVWLSQTLQVCMNTCLCDFTVTSTNVILYATFRSDAWVGRSDTGHPDWRQDVRVGDSQQSAPLVHLAQCSCEDWGCLQLCLQVWQPWSSEQDWQVCVTVTLTCMLIHLLAFTLCLVLRYRHTGPVAGVIFVIIAVINYIFLKFMEWWTPVHVRNCSFCIKSLSPMAS